MKPYEFISRAKSQLNKGIKYRMAGGKQLPVGSTCADEVNSCDCSAFVCWVARMRKLQEHEQHWLFYLNGGWLNTDGMWRDADEQMGNFMALDNAEPGAIIVYPAKWVSGVPGPRVGHVGIVVSVDSRKEPTGVIHCSSGNYRSTGDAIRVADSARLWTKRKACRYVWPSSVEYDGGGA